MIALALSAFLPIKAFAMQDVYQSSNGQCCGRSSTRPTNTGTHYAFFYKFAGDVSFESISLPMIVNSVQSQSFMVDVYENPVNGSTKGTLVGTSNTVNANTFPVSGSDTTDILDNNANLTTFTFGTPLVLTGSTTYLFQVRTTAASNGSGGSMYVSDAANLGVNTRCMSIGRYANNSSVSLTSNDRIPSACVNMLLTYTPSASRSGGATIIPIEKNMNATTTCITDATGTICTQVGYDYTVLLGIGFIVFMLSGFLALMYIK